MILRGASIMLGQVFSLWGLFGPIARPVIPEAAARGGKGTSGASFLDQQGTIAVRDVEGMVGAGFAGPAA